MTNMRKRTFAEWWTSLPSDLRKKSLEVAEENIDDNKKTIEKINYVLYHLNLVTSKDKKPTLDEFKFWFESGQLNWISILIQIQSIITILQNIKIILY